ncbi:MAG: hypothetical protein EA397_09755 [Deltaproteobacteria bacterium]|nr:MAG: hypothetical protein EA397_09755 [Deltaproteobacteria bacterium]
MGIFNPANVTNTPFDFDAGLEDVLDASSGNQDPVIPVERAVVINRPYAPEDTVTGGIFVADQTAGIKFFNAYDESLISGDPEPGSVISFDVNRTSHFRGNVEITDISNLVVHSEVEPVYVVDLTDGTAPNLDVHAGQNVHLWGEITEDRGSCGAPTCYTLKSGDHEYRLRVRIISYEIGNCVEVVAPLTEDNGEPQFDILDLDWVRRY